MKFSIYLPDSMVAEIEAAATAEGIGRAEWIRRACTQYLLPDTPGTPTDTPETSAALTEAHRDLAAVRADLAARIDEINWLRGQVALVNEQKALAETTGPGRRPWWRFWRS